jgi:PAS domain S-box-containing protein
LGNRTTSGETCALETLSVALLQTMPHGVVAYGEDGRCLWVNDSAALISGTSKIAIMDRPLSETRIWGPALHRDAQAASATRCSRERAVRLTRGDGEEAWVERRVEHVDLNGESCTVVGLEDVTDGRRREEALRLTQFSVDHAGDAVYWTDADGRLVYVNEVVCRRLGYCREELLGMTIFDLDPAAPRPWSDHWAELKQRGSFRFEAAHRTKTGELLPAEITVNYVEYGGKEYNCAFGRDITERKQMEESLRLTQFSVDRANDLVFWISPEGQYLYASDSTCRRLGYSKEELLGMTIYDVDPAAPRPWNEHWLDVKSRGSTTFETVHRTRDGEVFPTEVTANFVEY